MVFSLFVLLFAVQGFSQEETLLVGQVIDKSDKQPLSNVFVHFDQSGVGTTTNDEGYFVLRTTEVHTHLVVSLMGYKAKTVRVTPGESKGLTIRLSEENFSLPDLLIFPTENPAIAFMRKVRARRVLNNPMRFQGYKVQLQEQTYASIGNINKRNANRKLFYKLQKGLLTANDSTYFLPIYYGEKSFRLHDGKQTELQSDDKSIFPADYTVIGELIQQFPVQVNFYENYLSLFGKNFLSPLADYADKKYHYFFKDSFLLAEHKQYEIVFRPKNYKELLFEGSMLVDSASLALSNITAHLTQAANINFIQQLAFVQEFTGNNDKWVFRHQSLVANLRFMKQDHVSNAFFITKNSLFDSSLTDSTTVSSVTDTAFLQAIDTLQEQNSVKTINDLSQLFLDKYISVGKIDIGPVNLFSSYNKVEGNRFTVGARTGKELSPFFTVGGYGGYGLLDADWKYGGEFQYRFKQPEYAVLGLAYDNNTFQLDFSFHDQLRHENFVGNGLADFSTFLFRIDAGHYIRREQVSLFFAKQWVKGFTTHLGLASKRYFPNQFVVFSQKGIPLAALRDYSLTVDFRFSFKERVIDNFFHRIFLSNLWPITHVVFTAGNAQLDKNNCPYLKLHTATKQTVLLGIFGSFRYTVEAGTILGTVPYPLLELYTAFDNNGFGRYAVHRNKAFIYATDTYVNIQGNITTNGLLLNYIPIVNRCNLRETVGFKVAYGKVSDKQLGLMDLPSFIYPLQKPYVQWSAGITNIFKVMALESVWEIIPIKSSLLTWGVQVRFFAGF